MSDVAAGKLLTSNDIRELCAQLNIRPTKTLGQNFVNDPGTVRKIVRNAGVQAGEQVLEIGPGLGSLTLALLEAGAQVSAVEIDPPLAQALPTTAQARFPEAKLQVFTADALTITGPESIDGATPTRLVANLPYNVAVPIVLTVLEKLPSIQTVLVMVQAEVADRLAATPGNKIYGVPSAKVAWYASARRTLTIGRNVFYPVPNVDSALVKIERRPHPDTAATCEQVFAVIDAAFAQRRKTLRQALAGLAGSAGAAQEALERAGVSPTARGETLDIDQFAAVAQQLNAASAGACVPAASAPAPATSDPAVNASDPAVSVSAPGKVNLFLALGAARPDGYHPLNTIFAQIGLSETVTVSPLKSLATTAPQPALAAAQPASTAPVSSASSAPAQSDSAPAAAQPAPSATAASAQPGLAPAAQTGGPRIELALTRPDSNVPLDHTNLAYRAAQVVAQQAAQRGLATPDVHILLDKAVPVAGGMAGGSADAAATLKACNEFWQVGLSLEELAQLGAQLGADVPFGLYGGVALGTGRGDLIEPLKAAPGPYYWTFALQDKGLSTAAVFKHFDATVQAPPVADMPPEQLLAALEAGDVAEVSRHIRNDLQATAIDLRPELGQLIDLAKKVGALAAMVSGSGPTVAALSSSRAAAERVALCWSLTPFCDQVVTG
ncbi:dimethyladenosine transferase [Actinomyces graevenitzii F0530]|uniref:Multifunctional fusion protein n=1 Tax=Actinomyces graevenitzii F0530 TaxID=1321817 RepID=U1Q4J6_9ACTO|nr:dimethyladenosine transferase [Actinomyces graevenitzii F0530]